MYAVVEETNCAPPSRRVNASLTRNPLNPVELVIFGGECYDGLCVLMYNDLYKYNTDKQEWRRVTSPNRYVLKFVVLFMLILLCIVC